MHFPLLGAQDLPPLILNVKLSKNNNVPSGDTQRPKPLFETQDF